MSNLPTRSEMEAAALAGLMQERSPYAQKTTGVILSGGDIDRALYTQILSG